MDSNRIIIREANVNDYKAYHKINKEVLNLHVESLPWNFKNNNKIIFSKEYFKSLILDKDKLLYLAIDGEKTVGYILGMIESKPNIPIFVQRKYVLIDNLGVLNECKNKGVGTLLSKKIEDIAKKLNINEIQL